jgi:hypothetical protein
VSDPEQDRFWTCTGQQYCGTKGYGTGLASKSGGKAFEAFRGTTNMSYFALCPANTINLLGTACKCFP